MIPAFDRDRDGWPHGPRRMVLVGPPGTGKTTAVVDSLILPALRAGVREEDILAVSFTRAAAGEIGARLARELGGDAESYRLTSSTIHAESRRLAVRALGRLEMEDEEDRDQGLAEDVDDEEDEQDAARPRKVTPKRVAMLKVWDYARNTLAEGDTPAERLGRVWWRFGDDRRIARYTLEELAAEAEAYEDEKQNRGVIDFTDMLDLGLRRGAVPARELVIVDEAQDCSPLQWAVVERWMRCARRVVVVGDWDQAIHGWAGADSTPLLAYARARDWQPRRLARSWRVPRAAWALARALIQKNRDRIDAPYDHAPLDRPRGPRQLTGPGAAVQLLRADAIAAVAKASIDGKDVFVLARSRKILGEGLTRELCRQAVPFRAERLGYSPLLSPKGEHVIPVQIARAVLDLRAGGRARAGDVVRLLAALPAGDHFPSRKGGGKGLAVDEAKTWPSDALVGLEDLRAIGVELGTALAFGSLAELLTYASVGRKGTEHPERGEHLDRLLAAHGRPVLDMTPRVVLTTYHASKGREADVVLVDLEAPKPVQRRILDGEVDEERRLLYVGLTRVRGDLLVVRCPLAGRDLGDALGLGRVPCPSQGHAPPPRVRGEPCPVLSGVPKYGRTYG